MFSARSIPVLIACEIVALTLSKGLAPPFCILIYVFKFSGFDPIAFNILNLAISKNFLIGELV